ncbi:MAG TPA: hypothetical protein VFP89_02100 [Propionibacteriaceae bacterium]|nr:hypothetical protein [Propionibacteriaceae bacterium]
MRGWAFRGWTVRARTRLRRPTPGRVAGVVAAAVALGVLGSTTGCSYAREEPGLFRPPAPSPRLPAEPEPPERTNPKLPVLAETVWTSGEGLWVSTRLAVHAVRRIAGATVLDWSVTPLRAPGLRTGEQLPTWVDLGLTRELAGDVNVFLLDAKAGKVYRPLSHRSRQEFNRCLCTPVWVAELALRIGETRLLQTTYPELPSSQQFIDVDLVTVPPFSHVPVSPINRIPTARRPVDLARAAEPAPPLTGWQTFRPPNRNDLVQSIQIDRINVEIGLTSVQWTLRSLTDKSSFGLVPDGPPISAELPDGVIAVSPGSANGPQLRPTGSTRPLKARWMTTKVSQQDFFECLCTDLGLWAASLRQKGGSATLTTNFPQLPSGTRTVDVVLPTVGTLPGLPVSPAPDAAARSGPLADDPSGTWTYQVESPPSGWQTHDWPTPRPAARQLRNFVGSVEDVTTPPGW